MQFEARELKPYAQPVLPEDLRKGDTYFSVQFADERMLVPIIEPIVFLGRNLAEGDKDVLYFQKFESYSSGIRYDSCPERNAADFKLRGPDEIKHIFEFERALDELLSCSLRRRGRAR